MIRRITFAALALAVAAFVVSVNLASQAQTRQSLINQKIDDNVRVTLRGNVRPEANELNDRGPVSADLQLDHMLLLLRRPAELDAQLVKFIDDLHNPKSASFHKWLSAAQYGQKFGPAASDIAAVTTWLANNGFTVDVVYSNNMLIDFSGTASQVESAFHAQVRHYNVNGVAHIANASDPQVPAALAQVVAGVVSLNDFRPRALHKRIQTQHVDPKSGSLQPYYTTPSPDWPYLVVPWDLEKIYNITPLYSAGISGQGMKIVVIEDTNLYNCNASNGPGPCSATSDWAVFRSTFGLNRYSAGNASQENPAPQTGMNNCGNPDVNGDDDEAALDVEWSSAAAPSASIINAACADTRTTFGGLIALQNILSHPNADNVDVISISYGESETQNGAAANAAYDATYQQAVTQGIGIFVSSGDELAASAGTRDGITVSGFMSSPYDVSVGGLDFADTYLGENSAYWNATNNVFYGSAKSYIMEQPWNDSCASTLLAHYETGSYITYGATGFCNSSAGGGFHNATGGSGGPSGCATGAPAVPGVVGGTCAGWAKPAYQAGFAGIVADGVRDTPDVSLMAANGLWGHYYPFCYTDPAGGGVTCNQAPINWPGGGGTSFSSPIMAGIQALVVQHKGSLQGNPNVRYYALAATEYGANGNAACDSTLGNGVASSCVFYDVTLGDIDGYCRANRNGNLYNCYLPSGAAGVLSTSNNAYQPAYPTGPQQPFPGNSRGWDFGSGIGSVNAWNLVMQY